MLLNLTHTRRILHQITIEFSFTFQTISRPYTVLSQTIILVTLLLLPCHIGMPPYR